MSAEKGFKVFEEEKPDACVVDLIMEHHDSGFILCYKIKKTEHGIKFSFRVNITLSINRLLRTAVHFTPLQR